MSEYDDIEYRTFGIIALVIATIAGVIASIVLIASITRIKLAKIQNIRTDLIIIIHIVSILIALLIIYESFVYIHYLLIDAIIEILFSVNIAFFYFYMKECYSLFAYRHFERNTELRDRLVEDFKHREIMFREEPPFPSFKFVERVRLTDYYTGYCYVIKGSGKTFFCCHKKINNHGDSLSFTRKNNFFLCAYFLIVPIFSIIAWAIVEYDHEGIEIAGKVDATLILNIINAVLTVGTIPKITFF